MLKKIVQIWKIPDLRKSILFVLAMLVIFRIAAHIPVPGVDSEALKQLFASKRIVVMTRLKGYEFEHKCASIRPLEVPVLDLEAQHEKKLAQLLAQARMAVEQDGADTIVLGCGGILQIGEEISSLLNVPLIVPALAALKTCESLVRMNLLQSKRCHPLPEKKKRLSRTDNKDAQRVM